MAGVGAPLRRDRGGAGHFQLFLLSLCMLLGRARAFVGGWVVERPRGDIEHCGGRRAPALGDPNGAHGNYARLRTRAAAADRPDHANTAVGLRGRHRRCGRVAERDGHGPARELFRRSRAARAVGRPRHHAGRRRRFHLGGPAAVLRHRLGVAGAHPDRRDFLPRQLLAKAPAHRADHDRPGLAAVVLDPDRRGLGAAARQRGPAERSHALGQRSDPGGAAGRRPHVDRAFEPWFC